MAKETGNIASSGAQNNETTTTRSGIVEFTSAHNYEDVLRYDRAGTRYTFAHEKGRFLELTAEQYAGLSSYGQSLYSMARQLHAKDDPEQNEFAKHFQVGATQQGDPLNRVRGAKVTKGLTYNYFRPDQLDGFMEQGWRYPKAGEVLSGAKSREGHFELTQPSTGATEQVLLVKDARQERKDEVARAIERQAIGDQHHEAIRETIEQKTGYKAEDARGNND